MPFKCFRNHLFKVFRLFVPLYRLSVWDIARALCRSLKHTERNKWKKKKINNTVLQSQAGIRTYGIDVVALCACTARINLFLYIYISVMWNSRVVAVHRETSFCSQLFPSSRTSNFIINFQHTYKFIIVVILKSKIIRSFRCVWVFKTLVNWPIEILFQLALTGKFFFIYSLLLFRLLWVNFSLKKIDAAAFACHKSKKK